VSKYALETVFVKIAKTGKVCGVNWHINCPRYAQSS